MDSHSSPEDHKDEEEEQEDWLTPMLSQSSDDEDEQPSATEVSEQGATSSQSPLKSKQKDPSNNTRVVNKGKSKIDEQCCTCMKGSCLKRSCPCLASSSYCNGRCLYVDCENNLANKDARDKAISTLLERKNRKISSNEKQNKGCGCRNKGCTHVLCTCYHAKKRCSEACRCLDCKNTGETNAVQYSNKEANKSCRCQSSRCLKLICACRKANRVCSEVCKCKDCANGREMNIIQTTQQATNEAIRSAVGMMTKQRGGGGASHAVQNQAIAKKRSECVPDHADTVDKKKPRRDQDDEEQIP